MPIAKEMRLLSFKPRREYPPFRHSSTGRVTLTVETMNGMSSRTVVGLVLDTVTQCDCIVALWNKHQLLDETKSQASDAKAA